MTKLASLLDEYEESHRHPLNIAIHWVAEPFAILSLMALASTVALPIGNLLWPFLLVMLVYFGRLSVRVVVAFAPVVVVFVFLIRFVDNTLGVHTWQWASILFVVCWLALLGGHKIEGRVPSVFKNPNLIFVGPTWLMRRLFRRFGMADP